MLLSRKPHFLGIFRSPSVEVNTSIPGDRPRSPCILVSSTSFMSSLDHLKGFLSVFWVGCVSRAQLQLHYHTIEIRTGYWFLHYLVKHLAYHPTLAHWWAYFGTHEVLCPLLFLGCMGDSVRKPFSVMLPCIYNTWCCLLYLRDYHSQSLSPSSCVHL